jgi:Tfp pilus assembly PilM family ATPase
MMALTRRYGYIGLDLGGNAMKAVQVSRQGAHRRVEAAAVIPYPSVPTAIDATCAERIHDVCHRQGFRGDRLVIAAPEDKLCMELLDLPPRHSGAPVDQIARGEMMRLAKLDSDAFEIATWDLPAPPRGGTGTAVMAVAARHADTAPLYQLFADNGLHIEAIDVQACAIARACRARAHATGTTAVLDLGFGRAVMMFVRDGVLVFQRAFAGCGMNVVHAELIRRLSVDAEVAQYLVDHAGDDHGATHTGATHSDEAQIAQPQTGQGQVVQTLLARFADTLSAELESSFAYVMHRYSDVQPHEILVVGEGASASGVRQLLVERLGIPLEPLSPAKLVECAASTMEKCSAPNLTAALGLALYDGD